MYRFLFTPKWLGWFALAIVAALTCAALGMWQFDRRNQAVAEVEKVEGNYDAEPLSFEQARTYFKDFDPAMEWTPVTLEGTYDAEHQRVVRNRPLDGRPGYEVLVPLRLDNGSAVVVNRGWLPIGNERTGYPDVVPQPAEGTVEVTVRLKPAEPELDRGAPKGQLASINLDAYEKILDYPVYTSAYGLMASEDPAAATRPAPLGRPNIDTGPHLSYSMQWFAFGVLVFVGYGYAARQQARLNTPELADAPPKARKKPTEEDEEDALLDAQGYH
ncbi:SURF1 family protein [Arthrobacter castelli]|uniref:SURF1 family cytochrome oxidase biogenesis protein n=1 Tax=Arthrobacter castelli TaxID=271431 RepID=UPI00041CCE7F|nr:SURF1 family protein [Arthrobacter castelli]